VRENRNTLLALGSTCLLAALLLVAPVSPAGAFTITPTGLSGGNPGGQTLYEVSGLVQGDSFDVIWSLDGSGSPYLGAFPNLDATATLMIDLLDGDTLILSVSLANDTAPLPGAPDLDAVITVFGFEAAGVALGDAGNDLLSPGAMLNFYDEGQISGGLSVDVCASTNAKCNTGNPHDGMAIGESDFFTFTLQGDFDSDDGLVLRNFGTKWQTNYDDIVTDVDDNSSFQLPGTPVSVPEPATALLVGFSLVGLGLFRKLRP